jgi:type VI secretion system protein ImpL
MTWPNPTGTPGARISAITTAGTRVMLLDEQGRFGLKTMVESARRKRKDDGSFELTWENGGVAVTANLRIVGTTKPAAAPAPAPSVSGQGFKRLRLPQTIIAPAPAPAPAATPAAAAPVVAAASAGAAQ